MKIVCECGRIALLPGHQDVGLDYGARHMPPAGRSAEICDQCGNPHTSLAHRQMCRVYEIGSPEDWVDAEEVFERLGFTGDLSDPQAGELHEIVHCPRCMDVINEGYQFFWDQGKKWHVHCWLIQYGYKAPPRSK